MPLHFGDFKRDIIKDDLIFHMDAENPLCYFGLNKNRFAIKFSINFTTGPSLSPEPTQTEAEFVLFLEKSNIGSIPSGAYKRQEFFGDFSRDELGGTISGFGTSSLAFTVTGLGSDFVFTFSSVNNLVSWDIDGFESFFAGSSSTTFTFGTRGGDVYFHSLYPIANNTIFDISRKFNQGIIVPYHSFNDGASVFINQSPRFFRFTRLDMVHSPILSNQMTISLWCSFRAFISGDQGLISDWKNSSNLRSWMIGQISPGKIRFWLSTSGSSGTNLESASTLSTNTIYNIVCIYNGSNRFIYINNILDATGSFTGNLFQGQLFQMNAYDNTRISNAIYYSAAVYNRAITDSERNYNFNLLKDRYGV